MPDVNMPKLSDTMEEGTILEWKKKDGEEVHKGDVLAEVESDKATFDLEAEDDGVLSIKVEKGVPAKIGAPIATIGAASEAKPAKADTAKAEKPKAQEPKAKAEPAEVEAATDERAETETTEGPEDEAPVAEVEPAETEAPKPKAAPARRADGPETEVIEPTRMQATIARRMAESKATVPEFTVTVEARVDQAVSMRQQLKDSVPGAEKVTMTDFLVRACALALRKFPEVNTSWVDGKFQRKRSVNIGLAVAPSQGMGLLVPVVHDADVKDIVQISIESRQVIERARSGRPGEHDLTGATFSISNLGMFGVDEFTAIINPPEAAILAVGAIKDAAVVDDGKVVVGKVMRMTLTVDHRVFYGATAAQFMAEVKRLLENPVTLVVPSNP